MCKGRRGVARFTSLLRNPKRRRSGTRSVRLPLAVWSGLRERRWGDVQRAAKSSRHFILRHQQEERLCARGRAEAHVRRWATPVSTALSAGGGCRHAFGAGKRRGNRTADGRPASKSQQRVRDGSGYVCVVGASLSFSVSEITVYNLIASFGWMEVKTARERESREGKSGLFLLPLILQPLTI